MPRRRKDLIFEESLFNNMEDYITFKARFIDMVSGCFNFENLPEHIYKPFIISRMITEGKLLGFKDVVTDKFYLYPYVNEGYLNEYNLPTRRYVKFLNNGAQYHLTDENSVILRCNVSGTNLVHIIEYFARNIYLINRTIQINVNAQKTPVILTCPENKRLSYENLLKQYAGAVPFMFGSEDLDINNLKAINLNSPYVADKLYQLMGDYWNEFLTFIGIPNISINKKERLITDEVSRSMGGILIAKQNFENQIQDDIKQINNMFGLNIKFTWGVSPTNEYVETIKGEVYNENSIEDESEVNEQ